MSYSNRPVDLPGTVTPVELPGLSNTAYHILEERVLSDADTRVTSDGSTRMVADFLLYAQVVVVELPGNVCPVEVD